MTLSGIMRHWLRAGSPLWRLVCALCWTVVLAGLFAPADEVSRFVIQGSDKVLHCLALAAMMYTARHAFPAMPVRRFWGLAMITAVALECLQPIIQPDRDFSLWDMAANVLGVGLAALLLRANGVTATIRPKGRW